MQGAPQKSLRTFSAVFCAGLLLFACGKVGPPQPPFIRIPEAVKDLAVGQSGYELILTWTSPPRYIDGSTATDLARVQIREGGTPVATLDAVAAGKPQSYTLPASTIGQQRTFSVIVETANRKVSALSNAASIVPVDVPGKITHLTVTPDQRQIFVKWDEAEDHSDLADAYIVTRVDRPSESATVTETRYADSRYEPGKTVTYQVIAARRTAAGMVMGVGPVMDTVTIKDMTAPAIPSGLEIITADDGAYVTWDANIETDLAGYRVFRSDRPDTGFKPVTGSLIATNMFMDPSSRKGFYYAVSAVDDFNNESPMSAPFRAP